MKPEGQVWTVSGVYNHIVVGPETKHCSMCDHHHQDMCYCKCHDPKKGSL